MGVNIVKDKKAEAFFNYNDKQLTYTAINPTDLKVYDIAGRLILSKSDIQQNSVTNLSHLNSGMYFAFFITDNL